jgi:hypothetical protein
MGTTATAKAFEAHNGEAYVLRVEDFGAEGVKVVLRDPRDMGLRDDDRIHAVLLSPEMVSSFRRWLATSTLYLPGTDR